jgi:hypothetical protein
LEKIIVTASTEGKDTRKQTMTTLGEFAKSYEAQKIGNVADLERLPLNAPIGEKKGIDKDGQPYSYFIVSVNGLDYRCPSSVIDEIQLLQRLNPNVKNVKVVKTGSGMNTKYKVGAVD